MKVSILIVGIYGFDYKGSGTTNYIVKILYMW